MSTVQNLSARILVLDDEAGPRLALKMLLEREFQIELFDDGNKALIRAMESGFDAAFIDLRMPQIHGIEILRRLRELDPDMAVIIMTAYGELASAQAALQFDA